MSFIPNTTPTPNWLYNGEMKKMNETELKVVLLVTRKTLGWFDPMTNERKEQDYISQKQFMEFTGQSNRAIATAIDRCVGIGWIIARDQKGNICDTPEKRSRRKIWYQLGSVFTNKISSEESSQDQINDKNLMNIFPKSSEHFDTNLVKKVHSTKETLTKENILDTNVSNVQAHGNEDINKIISYWKEKVGHLTIRSTTRRSFYNLLRSTTLKEKKPEMTQVERVRSLIDVLTYSRTDKFAPRIATPEDLLAKQNNLIDWFIRKKQNNGNIIAKVD